MGQTNALLYFSPRGKSNDGMGVSKCFAIFTSPTGDSKRGFLKFELVEVDILIRIFRIAILTF